MLVYLYGEGYSYAHFETYDDLLPTLKGKGFRGMDGKYYVEERHQFPFTFINQSKIESAKP